MFGRISNSNVFNLCLRIAKTKFIGNHDVWQVGLHYYDLLDNNVIGLIVVIRTFHASTCSVFYKLRCTQPR